MTEKQTATDDDTIKVDGIDISLNEKSGSTDDDSLSFVQTHD